VKSRAVRLHAAMDLRLDEFELPPIKDDEMLVRVVSDTICMSTYKMAKLGVNHKRVHADVAEHPAITGHEFAGDIVEVGTKYKDKYKPGQKFTIQPAINYKGSMDSPGYSYEFCGGDSTYCILPHEIFDTNSFLVYNGEAYFQASLAEPLSCSIGALNAAYHTHMGVYVHDMGIKEGGNMAIVAGAGPMGLGCLTYAIHRGRRPGMLVVADINQGRLDRAESLFPPEQVKKETGVELHFVNNGKFGDLDAQIKGIRALTKDDKGFDDVLCYAPVASVVTLSDALLGRDGCLNFFSGPTDKKFSAPINFYEVHYGSHHVMGTTGGNTSDMIESLRMTEEGRMNPAVMITHIGGLNVAGETTCNLPNIPGGKKLIYTHKEMPLVALADLRKMAAKDKRYGDLADIVDKNNGLWNPEAERYVLKNWPDVEAR